MRRVTELLLLSVLLAGCSSTSSLFGSSSSSTSSPRSDGQQDFGDRVMGFLITGKSDMPKSTAALNDDNDDIECPQVTVREGAATWAISGPGEPSAMTLHYQGTIGRTARECRVVAKMVQMKVGMEGRIILGPAGTPGKVDVPVRFAVVREGPVPQTIVTRTYRKEVVLDPGATNVPFLQIDDSISFPMPTSKVDLENYVVYVGFDPEVLKPAARKPAARKPGPRKPAVRKPATSQN